MTWRAAVGATVLAVATVTTAGSSQAVLPDTFGDPVPTVVTTLTVAADSTVSTIPPADTTPPVALPRDTTIRYTRSPVSPMGALWRSLLIPGWGQARLNRRLTGALFVAWEGVTLGMSLKVSRELTYLRRTGSLRVRSKQKEREDWLVLLCFNHLFSAIEAYVSSHLWDFPGDLEVRPMPGGIGGGVRLPVRLR